MGSGTESQCRISGTVEHAIAGADTTCHIVVVSTPSDREGEHSTSLQCCVCHIKMRTPTGSHILAGHPTTVTVVEHSVVSVLGATLYILLPNYMLPAFRGRNALARFGRCEQAPSATRVVVGIPPSRGKIGLHAASPACFF